MRIHKHGLLALPAILSALVVAVPSPAPYLQQTVPAQAEQQSRWRSLTDRLIGSIWGVEKDHEYFQARRRPSYRQPPAHTLARYGGDVVLRFNVSTAEETRSLAEAADTLLLDVWEFSQDWVDIRLAKDVVPSLLGLLPTSLQQSHAPLLYERDLAQAIYNTYPVPRDQNTATSATLPLYLRNHPTLQHSNPAQANDFFADYLPLKVIEPWMRLFALLYTTHVRLIKIGTSYEGRDILGLRVGVHPTNNEDPNPKKRKTVLITGGSHAREWISTSTVNYVAYSLFTGYGKSRYITNLLEDFDFVFIPVLNPDGYFYTWETDRLWRKNRQQTNIRFCQGIDLDRAFGFEWDAISTAGNPCSENFAGDAPFEAVESKRLADWAKNETEKNNVQFVGFLDLHSYSQQILYPYSYSCEDTPPGQENLEELAVGLEKAIRLSSGVTYEPIAACEGNVAGLDKGAKRTLLPRIEEQGGSALDWFYHEMQVRYAYQIKLRDRGTYGFLLPKENIIPTGKEILEAVLYFGQFLQDTYDIEASSDLELEKPNLDGESVEVSSSNSENDVAEEEWVVVEDLAQEEPALAEGLPEGVQWELKRRRRR